MAAPRAFSSASMRKPQQEGRNAATPAVEAWARWTVPKASETKTWAKSARALANAGAFFSSSGWKRRFSNSRHSPGFKASAIAFTSGPTQSGARGTFFPSSSPSRSATGARVSSGFTWPLGRPRWEQRTREAPRSRI